MAGTPLYMAPEVITGSYSKEADMWSLGVLLYVLVSGFHPFHETTTKKVFDRVQACDWKFEEATFRRITPECKDLISKLIEPKLKKRLTGQQAINH